MKISKEIIDLNNSLNWWNMPKGRIMDAVLSFYKKTGQPIRQKTISELTGIAQYKTSVYLFRLIDERKIKKVGRGLYCPIDVTEGG